MRCEKLYLARRAKVVEGLASFVPPYEPFDNDKFTAFKVLWLLVIRQALFDYVKWKDSKEINNRRDAEDARKWLFEESSLNNSLQRACEMVGVNIRIVRETALRLRVEDVKKMEFQERERDQLSTAMATVKMLQSTEDEDEDGDD